MNKKNSAYTAAIEQVSSGIQGINDYDVYVNQHEPFLCGFKVIALADSISVYTLNKLNELYETIYEHTTGMSRMYVESTETGLRAYFVAFQGKNGCGDFCADDLSNAIAILQGLRKLYKNATMIDMKHDILDDVSAWSYVFEI